MANRRTRDTTYRGASIDTAPGAAGYWTEAVKAHSHHVGKLYMSIRGTFVGTVTLQFRPKGDTSWTAYDTYTEVTRQIIEDYTETEWRVGVASGDYTSGTIRIGIDYHDGENR